MRGVQLTAHAKEDGGGENEDSESLQTMSNHVYYTNIGKLRCLPGKLGHCNSHIEWIKVLVKQ